MSEQIMRHGLSGVAISSLLLTAACGHYRSYDDGCFKGVCTGDEEHAIYDSVQLEAFLPPHLIIPCNETNVIRPEDYDNLKSAQCVIMFENDDENCYDQIVVVIADSAVLKIVDIEDCGWGTL